ncbi:MAG: hypothetical protein NZ455_05425 [Bacteroidia bacterium]|nr:hypothetical protein [Bacteroidia bacterium]MDW8345441.1 hypothetical protein [Bacteroidia bacterium]
MREACGGQAVRLGAKPLTHALNPITRGWAGGGAAPSARSTPTLPTRAQRDVGKDTPKKLKLNL